MQSILELTNKNVERNFIEIAFNVFTICALWEEKLRRDLA